MRVFHDKRRDTEKNCTFMVPPKTLFTLRPAPSFLFCRCRESLGIGILLSILVLPGTAKAQVEVIYDWNGTNDVGWTRYTPAASGGGIPQYTFPADGSGGSAYRMVGPPLNCQGIFNRGGSYRAEQYSEFFFSVDVVDFDPRMLGTYFFL